MWRKIGDFFLWACYAGVFLGILVGLILLSSAPFVLEQSA
jgi:hypothetical protein